MADQAPGTPHFACKIHAHEHACIPVQQFLRPVLRKQLELALCQARASYMNRPILQMIDATTKGAAQQGFAQAQEFRKTEQKKLQEKEIAETEGTCNEAGEASIGEANCENQADR